MSIRQTIELYFTGERLITPSGLGSVGNMLSKSEFVRYCNQRRDISKRSEPYVPNGDITLTYIGQLVQGKPTFEAVREMQADPEYYRIALGLKRGIPSAETLRQRLDAIGDSIKVMNEQNILNIVNRWEFRAWLEAHASAETECWVAVKRGRPSAPEVFYYLDAVEEALCFGWVDSVQKQIDGKRMQRFSPRKSNSPWTELNKARVRRLESLGRMTDAGRAVLPAMGPRSFRMDREIEAAMKAARVWSEFRSFPALYQRVRAYNVAFYKNRAPEIYQKALAHLIEETKRGRMFGEWNDYGRLPDD